MKRKLFLALLTIVTVSVGVGLYYYLSPISSNPNKYTLVVYKNIDTSNWKTYTSERYGLSFKYPPEAKQNGSVIWESGKYSIDIRIPMRARSTCKVGAEEKYLGNKQGTDIYRNISKNVGLSSAISPGGYTDEICLEQQPGMVTVIYIGTTEERSDIGDGILNTFFLPQQDPSKFFLP